MATDSDTGQQLLASLAKQESVDLISVADVRQELSNFHGLPQTSLSQLPRAIVIVKRVSPTVLDTLEDGPNLIYYHHYRQLNFLLDRAAMKIGAAIESRGFRALPVAASQITDWKEQLAHVPHKKLAWLAGLGWRGRNSLLVTPGWGAQVRLASILTDMPLATATPLDRDCGSCRKCLAVCPAGALKESPADFEKDKCRDKLKEFTKTRGIGVSICGLCVKACVGPGA